MDPLPSLADALTSRALKGADHELPRLPARRAGAALQHVDRPSPPRSSRGASRGSCPRDSAGVGLLTLNTRRRPGDLRRQHFWCTRRAGPGPHLHSLHESWARRALLAPRPYLMGHALLRSLCPYSCCRFRRPPMRTARAIAHTRRARRRSPMSSRVAGMPRCQVNGHLGTDTRR